MEDAMTTFRKTLMATTMLAGLAIFALDAAQAGPNGGPSLGSISGFSSMRMDFNRVGGPGRALSRDDTRVVPLDVKKTEKIQGNKNAAKKGTDIARVSNPKPASGGKGKEVVSATRAAHPRAARRNLPRDRRQSRRHFAAGRACELAQDRTACGGQSGHSRNRATARSCRWNSARAAGSRPAVTSLKAAIGG